MIRQFDGDDRRPGPTDASWCEECQTSDDPCLCELNEQRVTRARGDHLDGGAGDAG